jgi:rRNA-processing protein FCF1
MDVVIPYGVINIGSGAFAYCGNLTTITIPATVECIGDQAFMKCKKLTIKGYADSCAQKYAKANKIRFVAIDDTSL